MARLKRIALLNFYSSGLFQYGTEIANGLAEENDVVIHLTSNRHNLKIVSDSPNLSLISWDVPASVFGILRLIITRALAYKIYRAVKNFKPDVIHFNDLHPLHLITLALFHKTIPVVLTLHDPTPHTGEAFSWYWKLAIPYAAKRADVIVVHGQKMREVAQAQYSLPDDKVVIIPHGVYDIYLKAPVKSQQESPPMILFFGRVMPYKGPDIFIEAIKILIARKVKLKAVIAGVGASKYSDMISSNLREKITLIEDHIREEDVPDLFDRSTVVVMPYREATQSGVLPIVFARSRAVVATAVGSIPEVVRNGKNGLLVDPGSVEKIADGIELLLKDKKLRLLIEKNAGIIARDELSRSKIVSAYRGAYELARKISE